MRERGGLFVAEYRTLSPAGQIRRILDRGRIPAGASSRHLGHGIIIDVTESQPVTAPVGDREDALAQAVDRALECRDVLEGVADSELQLLIDMLLPHLGRRIARASVTGAGRRSHRAAPGRLTAPAPPGCTGSRPRRDPRSRGAGRGCAARCRARGRGPA
ncbi:hypothetical protein [Methylobacterium sp. P5_C11]